MRLDPGGGGGGGGTPIYWLYGNEPLERVWFSSHLVWYRVTKLAKFGLVNGRTFVNPASHPHPNYMGVPPPWGLDTGFPLNFM